MLQPQQSEQISYGDSLHDMVGIQYESEMHTTDRKYSKITRVTFHAQQSLRNLIKELQDL
jgi:hypothetical protein